MVSYTIVVLLCRVTAILLLFLHKGHCYQHSSQTNYGSQLNCCSTDAGSHVVGLHFVFRMVVNHVGSFSSSFCGCGRVGSCFVHGMRDGFAVYGKAISWFRFFKKNHWATAILILCRQKPVSSPSRFEPTITILFSSKFRGTLRYHSYPLESRFDKGSSSNNMFVFAQKANPNLVRCFMPDENSFNRFLEACVSPMNSKTSVFDIPGLKFFKSP